MTKSVETVRGIEPLLRPYCADCYGHVVERLSNPMRWPSKCPEIFPHHGHDSASEYVIAPSITVIREIISSPFFGVEG